MAIVIVAFALWAGTSSAMSQDADLQLWMPIQLIHPVDDRWAFSMQAEPRLKDDISEFSQLVLKPAINFHFNDRYAFSVGYKFIEKYHEPNEHDIWQELHLNRQCGDLATGLQFRLEERLIEGMDGAIPRLRVLEHFSHPIGQGPNYVTGFWALRFNLDDQGAGPVSGFEQSRIYAAFGRHIGPYLQFESGYLWRFERERTATDHHDHAIHFQLVIKTRRKDVLKPTTRDRYR